MHHNEKRCELFMLSIEKESQKTRDFYFYCLRNGVVLRHTEDLLVWMANGFELELKRKSNRKISASYG